MLNRLRLRLLLGAAPLALALSLMAAASAPDVSAQTVPVAAAAAPAKASQVSEFRLENGLRVVVVPDHRVPVVTHMVWYAVAAADEAADEHGVAHYLEHMMFKGTAAYPKGFFDRFVSSRGGAHNATTSMDNTVYFQRLPKSALPQIMAMEADRMANLRIDDADVASERAVVLEEFRRREVGITVELDKKVRAALYGGDPRARTVIGTEEEIKALSGATAQRFYERFYGPQRATVIIAGDISETEARTLAAETYGRVPMRHGLAPRVAGSMPVKGAHQRVEAQHERATTAHVSRTYVVPAGPDLKRQDSHALSLFSYIAGGGLTSRLHKRLVNEQAQATAVNCGYTFEPQASVFECSATGRLGVAVSDLEASFVKVLDELNQGVTDEEFEEIKSRFLATSAFRKDNVYERAQTFGSALAKGRTIAQVESFDDEIAALTRDDVERVAKDLLLNGRHVTGLFSPAAKPVAKTSVAN